VFSGKNKEDGIFTLKKITVMQTDQVNVRYMVEDVNAAIEFYTKYLGFTIGINAAPAFADVTRGNLRLLLSGRKSSAGRAMPDGTLPFPGGWNRIELVFENLSEEVEKLKAQGLHFRNDIVTGPGGSQILLIDPSGNFIELFEPKEVTDSHQKGRATNAVGGAHR
jgi:predicted enzyme related to lactoylglutathione lyase